MNVVVRLYWQHDLDLIALARHPDFQIGPWLKRAVIACARGEDDLVIPLPPNRPAPMQLDNCTAHFSLNPAKDNDVIQFILQFRYGFRNSAIKQIFRYYLESPNMAVFFDAETYLVKCRGASRNENGKAIRAHSYGHEYTGRFKPKDRSNGICAITVSQSPCHSNAASPVYRETRKPTQIETSLNRPYTESTSPQKESSFEEFPNDNAKSASGTEQFDLFAAIDDILQK